MIPVSQSASQPVDLSVERPVDRAVDASNGSMNSVRLVQMDQMTHFHFLHAK
jgi:hypothetical protein